MDRRGTVLVVKLGKFAKIWNGIILGFFLGLDAVVFIEVECKPHNFCKTRCWSLGWHNPIFCHHSVPAFQTDGLMNYLIVSLIIFQIILFISFAIALVYFFYYIRRRLARLHLIADPTDAVRYIRNPFGDAVGTTLGSYGTLASRRRF